jgi:hypothetical protein
MPNQPVTRQTLRSILYRTPPFRLPGVKQRSGFGLTNPIRVLSPDRLPQADSPKGCDATGAKPKPRPRPTFFRSPLSLSPQTFPETGAGVGLGATFGSVRTSPVRHPRLDGGAGGTGGAGGARSGNGLGRTLATGPKLKPTPETTLGSRSEKPRKPAYRVESAHIGGGLYPWHCYPQRKTFLAHCVFRSSKMIRALESLGASLAQHCQDQQREAVLLTVMFYRAPSAESSLREGFKLLEQLREWLGEEPADLLLSAAELHRVVPGGFAEGVSGSGNHFSDPSDSDRESFLELPDASSDAYSEASTEASTEAAPLAGASLKTWPVAHWVRDSQSPNSETRWEEKITREQGLLGHLHLHLLLVLDFEQIDPLRVFLNGRSEAGLNALVRVVGRGREEGRSSGQPGPRPEAEVYGAQMVSALRYLLKEYRIEKTEGFFRRLEQNCGGGSGRYAKFQCFTNPRLAMEFFQPLRSSLEELQKLLPSLKLGVNTLGPGDGPARGFNPQGTPAEKISQMLRHYLESSGLMVFYRRPLVNPKGRKIWSLGLLQPVPLPGQRMTLRRITDHSAEVFGRLEKFYRGQPALFCALVSGGRLERAFYRCAGARTFDLPKELLLDGFGSFYSLRDGTTVWYGQNQPLFRSWSEGLA